MSIHVDVAPVKDGQEAEFLVFYHLSLAAAYFEATDDNLAQRIPPNLFHDPATRAWVAAMEALYPEE